jgi:hypothetical protein
MEELIGGTKIIQSFVTDGRICGIDLFFGTFMRTNTKEVVVHVRDDIEGREDLVTKRISAASIKDNVWERLSFPPVKSEKSNLYYLVIESPQSVPGNAVTLGVSDDNPYPDGNLILYNTGNSVGGIDPRPMTDIAFRVYVK